MKEIEEKDILFRTQTYLKRERRADIKQTDKETLTNQDRERSLVVKKGTDQLKTTHPNPFL